MKKTLGNTLKIQRAIKNWTQELRKAFGEYVKHFDEAGPDILMEALRPTYEESQELVPVKTGVLKASGFLRAGKFRGIPTAEIGYADGGRPFYAAKVHEDLDVYHKPPTQAKFLEMPLRKNMNDIKNRVIFLIKEAAGG